MLLSLLSAIFLSCNCFEVFSSATSENLLVEHVTESILNAESGISKLSQDVLILEGMSSAKVRHL